MIHAEAVEENGQMTITEFLEARIAEDEERNNPKPDPSGSCDYLHGVHYESARILAECAAKRAVVEAGLNCETYGDQVVVLRALASAYKDHPEYDQDWAL